MGLASVAMRCLKKLGPRRDHRSRHVSDLGAMCACEQMGSGSVPMQWCRRALALRGRASYLRCYARAVSGCG